MVGGTLITTDIATSTESPISHPTLSRDGVIDHMLALDDIPGLLTALTSHPLLGGANPTSGTGG